MARTPRELPRCHTQRRSLGHGKNTAISDLQSKVHRRRHKSQDSRYESNSDDDDDADAEYLNALIDKFEEDGPQCWNYSLVGMPTQHSLLGEPTRCVPLSVSGEALGRQSSLNADIYRGLASH